MSKNSSEGGNRAAISEMFRYGFGGVGSNIAFMLVLQFLMFFLTEYVGVAAAAVGTLFLVSRLVDAVTDPVMGIIADRSNSRWGKYRPWIIFGAPLLGVSMVLLFWNPPFGITGKWIYVYGVYIFYSLISTVVNIPYHSLTPVITEDSDQRTTVATFKQVAGIVGTLIVVAGTVPIVKKLGDDAAAYTQFALICALLVTISFFICAWGASGRDTRERWNMASASKNSVNRISVLEQLKLIVKNRALLMLMIAFGTDLIAFAAASSVNVYYFTYAVNDKSLIPVIGMYGIAVSVGVSMLIPVLSRFFGKKKLFLTGTTILLLLSLFLFFTPLTNIALIITLGILIAGFGPVTAVIGWAMLADCVEYGEWKTGYSGAGTVSSQLTFINKLGMAIGGFLGGAILGAAGYVANQPQTPETVQAIVGIKTLLPVAGYICSLISMAFYPITREFFQKIAAENKERRGEV